MRASEKWIPKPLKWPSVGNFLPDDLSLIPRNHLSEIVLWPTHACHKSAINNYCLDVLVSFPEVGVYLYYFPTVKGHNVDILTERTGEIENLHEFPS